MKRRKVLSILISAVVVAIAFVLASGEPDSVQAHPGGLAGDGCHYCRTNCARWGHTYGTRHCHRAPAPRQVAPRSTPTPTPQPTPTGHEICNRITSHYLVIDTQGRVAVPRHLAPSQPDGDNDGFACGGQLEHKRHLVPPAPTPRPTPTPRTTPPLFPKRANGDVVRYTPTNAMYGMCRSTFPYTHLDDCNLDYDFLMRFWLMYQPT